VRFSCAAFIGGKQTESGAIQALAACTHIDLKKQILTTNVWSSELSKLTATLFSPTNLFHALSALCEATTDVDEVFTP
jgi:UDPglucose 6-dehydrogenase